MAVPSLPTNLASGDVLSEAWVDATRSLLAFLRDDRPLFYGRSVGSQSISTASTTAVQWSDGAGAFNVAPAINVGGFTASSTGDRGVLLPEAGAYLWTVQVEWQANATGTRQLQGTLDGSTFSNLQDLASTVGSGGEQHQMFTGLIYWDGTGSEELSADVTQNSGGNLFLDGAMTICWMGSSSS